MPTGYTAPVESGEITTVKDYAMTCARAFGATITMRDEPFGTPIPEAFEPSDYYAKVLVAVQGELDAFNAMSEDEKKAAYDKNQAERRQEHAKRAKEDQERVDRYIKMKADVQAWQVPASLAGLKEFMLQQLETGWPYQAGPLQPITFDDWKVQRVEGLQWSIANAEAENRKEIERVASRNAWLKDLRESFAEEQTS